MSYGFNNAAAFFLQAELAVSPTFVDQINEEHAKALLSTYPMKAFLIRPGDTKDQLVLTMRVTRVLESHYHLAENGFLSMLQNMAKPGGWLNSKEVTTLDIRLSKQSRNLTVLAK